MSTGNKAECTTCSREFLTTTLDKNNGVCGRCVKTPEGSKPEEYKKAPIPTSLRQALWLRDCGNKFFGNCYTCRMKISVYEFSAGHIESEFTGGKTSLENLRVVCKSCNSKMGIRNMEEFKRDRYGRTWCCWK